jgi:hypothetical protein
MSFNAYAIVFERGLMMKKLVNDSFVDAEYDSSLLAFVFEGCMIRNPYLSKCGRFQVEPIEAYGFQPHHTGGGCMALIKTLDDGRQIWITDDGGSAIPEADEIDEAVLGVFVDGEQLAYITMRDIPMEGEIPALREEPKAATRKARNTDEFCP